MLQVPQAYTPQPGAYYAPDNDLFDRDPNWDYNQQRTLSYAASQQAFQPQVSDTPVQKRRTPYRDKQPQQNIFAPPTPNPGIYVSAPVQPSYIPEQRQSQDRSRIPMIDPGAQRKQQYNDDLQRQISDRQQRKKRSREAKNDTEEYFPFGKAGAGAPYRDQYGNIISNRPPRFNENDPNFLRTSEFYKTLAKREQDNASPQLFNQSPLPARPPPPNVAYSPQPIMASPQVAEQIPPPFGFREEQAGSPVDPRKADLARSLQEQMDEKKRQQEEEKRQRILEERMEEARLEKQRRELEEEYRREQEKKKKDFQDLQTFNENNFVVATKKKQTVRSQTPVDPPKTPPRAPPDFRTHREHTEERIQTEIPIRVLDSLQSGMDNEVWKVRNEINHTQNELRDNIVRLKEEAQVANEQRYNAQRELEIIKDNMRQRQLEDDIRSRELYNALVLQKNPMGVEPITRMPKYQKQPLELIRQHNIEPYLDDTDASKSLRTDTIMVPLAAPEGLIAPEDLQAEMGTGKAHAIRLDNEFPSLPDNGPSNLDLGTLDPTTAISSNLGLDNIDRKNEQRLRMLERAEQSQKKDDLAQLDDILFSYLQENQKEKTNIPVSRGKYFDALNSIAEDDLEEGVDDLTKAFYGQASVYPQN